ncbi:hypothetical protein B9G53_06080 [Pseudanabaena sp. SR411]|nr:hypothetical protein B9G53_06080 [Pseudanabaena sp. SR411]
MLIDNYFAEIRNILSKLPIMQRFELATKKRTDTLDFIRGNICFNDGSLLHIREFVSFSQRQKACRYFDYILRHS